LLVFLKNEPSIQQTEKLNPSIHNPIRRLTATLGRLALLFTVALSLVSCATDVANRYYAGQSFPPKNPSEVVILRSAPNRPYEVIADFQSRGESEKSVRKKAAKIGADAVIISILGGYYNLSTQWASDDAHANTYTRICGTAIVYKQTKKP
jgi:predicted 2-oxoglutarate/Fe(II)-dependent dioxygenase YbiX